MRYQVCVCVCVFVCEVWCGVVGEYSGVGFGKVWFLNDNHEMMCLDDVVLPKAAIIRRLYFLNSPSSI